MINSKRGLLKPYSVRITRKKNRQSLFGSKNDSVLIKSGYVRLKVKESVGEHITDKKEEVIIVLKGKARITLGNRKMFSSPYRVVYIPPGVSHDVKNIGSGILEYVYVVCRMPH